MFWNRGWMRGLALLMLLACCVPLHAENVLRNADARDLSPFQMPMQWEVRSEKPDGFTVREGVLRLDAQAGGSEVYLIQRRLELEPETRYQLRYQVRGVGTYRSYVEWVLGETMANVGARWQPVTDVWEERSLEVVVTPEAERIKVVFHTRGQDAIELKDLRLQVAAVDETIGQNLDFAQRDDQGAPAHWSVRGGPEAVRIQDGVATLRQTGDAAPFLIQTPLPLEAGVRYRVSLEVRGETGGTFRAYVEEVQKDGTRRASGQATAAAAPSAWREVTFLVEPQAADSRKQWVLNAGGGPVHFRALAITKVGAEEAQADRAGLHMLAAPVELHGQSEKGVLLDATPAVTVVYVNNYVPGATVRGVRVEPGKRYELTFQVEGQGESTDSTGFHFYDVRIDLKDGSEIIRSGWDDVHHLQAHKRFVFQIPESHPGHPIDIGMGVTQGSRVAFHLETLEEVALDPADTMRLVITSPAYRDGLYVSHPVAEVAGFVAAEAPATSVAVALRRGEQELTTRSLFLADGRAVFSFDADLFASGGTELIARVLDGSGAELQTLTRTITRHAQASQEVVIGQDRQFYVNGRPFFPIKHYAMLPHGHRPTLELHRETIGFVSRAGANLFILAPRTEAEALALLDLLAEHHSMMLLNTSYIRGKVTPERIRLWGHRWSEIATPRVLAHRAFFGFYLADEPRWMGAPVENIQQSYDVLRTISSYHPTIICEAPRGSIEDHRPYAAWTDVYGQDIYPVPNGSHSDLDDKTITSVGKYTRRMAEVVEGRKPIMMVLQAFAWGELNARTGWEVIYPTWEEARFMAYDVFLSGGTHVAYYRLAHVRTPAFVEVINRVTLELHRMSRLLTLGETVLEHQEGPVRYRVIAYGGHRYGIALNASSETQQATVRGGFQTASVQELTEERVLPVAHGAVTDTFEPFAVRVYAEAPLPVPLQELPAGDVPNPWVRLMSAPPQYRPYQGAASWIWELEQTGRDQSEVYLARPLTLDRPVRQAVMYASADNWAEVFVNGQSVGEVDDWQVLTELDLTPYLKSGENLISVHAADGVMLPCGFLAEIKVVDEAGKLERIVTDAAWLCSPTEIEGWKTLAVVREQFKPVDYQVPYGQGRWGERVTYP